MKLPLSAGEQPRIFNKQMMSILSLPVMFMLVCPWETMLPVRNTSWGVRVGTKQQFMHLAGLSVAFKAKLPCPGTPGVHVLGYIILQLCFKICSSVKRPALISCLCAEMQGVFDFS